MDLFLVTLVLAAHTSQPTSKPIVPQHYVATSTFVDGRIDMPPQTPKIMWPAVQHDLSQDFHSGHEAIDIYGKIGQPVVAMSDGIVSVITTTGPYGNKIEISHPRLPNTTTTLYAHLDDISVIEGQSMKAGQVIGHIGVTGNSTGPHLHFEVHQGDTQVDPLSVLQL